MDSSIKVFVFSQCPDNADAKCINYAMFEKLYGRNANYFICFIYTINHTLQKNAPKS